MKPILATMRAALFEAWTNRRSFWVQVTFMVANDAVFIVFWLIFFDNVNSVRGWDIHLLLALFGILATITGITMGILGNARRLGQLVAEGELDAALSLPVDPLAYLLVRRVDTALLGDLAFGPAMFLLSGLATWETWLVFLLGVAVGTTVLVSFMVILASVTLFVGGRGEQGDIGFHALLMISSYPMDLFGGTVKLLLFTLLPAAFITGLPTHLVVEFNWATAAAMLAFAVGAAVLARTVFRRGLIRYRSGALWTAA